MSGAAVRWPPFTMHACLAQAAAGAPDHIREQRTPRLPRRHRYRINWGRTSATGHASRVVPPPIPTGLFLQTWTTQAQSPAGGITHVFGRCCLVPSRIPIRPFFGRRDQQGESTAYEQHLISYIDLDINTSLSQPDINSPDSFCSYSRAKIRSNVSSSE